jgi:hypothetical protein
MIQDKDLYWLAGLLEGEGCFSTQTEKLSLAISLQMTDEDIVKRVADLFQCKYYRCYSDFSREKGHKPSYKITFRGKRALQWMKTLLPLMGNRRSQKITECIDSFKLKGRGILKDEQISEIRKRFARGEKPKDIAKDFPVSFWRVYQIVR